MDYYVHIHFDVHKTVESMLGGSLYMHVPVGLCFSSVKNTLKYTVVQRLTLFQKMP